MLDTRHRINVGRHHIQRIFPIGGLSYSQWLTDNFPLADRWDHQDLPGSSVLEAYNTALALGRELFVKDFTAGLWVTGGTGTIVDSDTYSTTGAGGARVDDPSIAAGKTYTARLKGTTTASGIELKDFGSGSLYKALTPAGGTFDESFTFTALADGLLFRNIDAGTTDIDWPNTTIEQTDIAPSSDFPTPGDNPMDGTTTVAQVGVPTNFGSLGLSVVDDGAASFSKFHSAEVNSKFNPAAGFINIWAKVSGAGVWADGVNRVIASMLVDSENSGRLLKASDNILYWRYEAGNAAEIIGLAITPLDWFMLTMTWEKPGNMTAYFNGVQTGTPQVIAGTWVGNFSSTDVTIGAISTAPTQVWDGSRTRFMLGYEAITPAQVLSLYNQGRR